jgi:hypothetical protein
MTSARDGAREHLAQAEIEDWYRHADGKQDGQSAGLGIQARDRKIRRLIEELRRLRGEAPS